MMEMQIEPNRAEKNPTTKKPSTKSGDAPRFDLLTVLQSSITQLELGSPAAQSDNTDRCFLSDLAGLGAPFLHGTQPSTPRR